MSPVVRKWGMRGIVAISTASIGLMGTLLTMSAFGGVPTVGRLVSPESWFEWSERFGFPLVMLGLFVVLGVWATRAVWKFAKPLVEKLVTAVLNLIEKQSDFIDTVGTHQHELKALVETGQDGHERTHELLTKMADQQKSDSRKIGDIHSRVGGGR